MGESLEDILRQRAERMGPDQPFASSEELADDFGVDPSAVRHAMRRLVADGVVVSQGQGRGNRYVTAGAGGSETAVQRAVRELRRLVADAPRGARLPTQRAAAQRFGVSSFTMAEEYRRLQREGEVRIERGARGGVFKAR